MADGDLIERIEAAGFSFTGTVGVPATAAFAGMPVDARSAVVRVEEVLHGPDALSRMKGIEVVVQLSKTLPAMKAGDRATFFTDVTAVGERLVLAELGRLPVEAPAAHMAAAMTDGVTPRVDFRQQVEDRRLGKHAKEVDAVVVATVVGLQKSGPRRFGEHEPDWWCATLEVDHVERGAVPAGQLKVLYANSRDVRWRQIPKPKAGQHALWLLHATAGEQQKAAPYLLADADDLQAAERLETLRDQG